MEHRRDFLTGMGAGVVAGGLGQWGLSQLRPSGELPPEVEKKSYSQAGEDLLVDFLFGYLRIPLHTYLDVGAYQPILGSNTYLMYRKGARGVLVEPNVDLIDMLCVTRPEDKVLNIGIGIDSRTESDFFVMNAPQCNTFSREQAEHLEQSSGGRLRITRVVKMPLVNINEVLAKHLETCPNFVSLDTEGLDLDILKTLDFAKYRPQVFCVETLIPRTTRHNTEIIDFLTAKDYVPQGGSLPNTIFVDRHVLDAYQA